ncbi:MAG: transcription antitermination protein NusB [Bacteroidota bacterium]|nr:transcription antitermination protein NusB [Bacteroidota bacterium]|tara:strand:+ start:1874 stop:2749 length:876 start_codon:yes stop_codon:yes gene_type:complete
MSSKNNEISFIENSMLKHFDEVAELKLVIISLLVEIVKYADVFYEDGKKKYLPSSFDLNPNKRFVNNQIVVSIINDKELIDETSKVSSIWLNNDHDVIRKIFNLIIDSELYNQYLEADNTSIDDDKIFIINLMNDYILNNKLVHHIFEERSIYWIDDLPFIATIIFNDIRNDISMSPKKVFKDISDKEFALNLFRNTITHNIEYEKIIVRFATNWDLDRIAKMDQVLLKMAFSEILSMPHLPIKVSMNEYIEIAKYYSTSKSKLFVNGLLDNFVKTYTQEGKITKEGRGLI